MQNNIPDRIGISPIVVTRRLPSRIIEALLIDDGLVRVREHSPFGRIVCQLLLVPERFRASFEINRVAKIFLPRENPGDGSFISSVRAVTFRLGWERDAEPICVIDRYLDLPLLPLVTMSRFERKKIKKALGKFLKAVDFFTFS